MKDRNDGRIPDTQTSWTPDPHADHPLTSAQALQGSYQPAEEDWDSLAIDADEQVLLHALFDDKVAQSVSGAPAIWSDSQALLDPTHDPDELLANAIRSASESRSRWSSFQRWIGSSKGIGGLAAVVAASALFFSRAQPAPDYTAQWGNGVAEERGIDATLGRFVVGNEAELVLSAGSEARLEAPSVRIFVRPSEQSKFVEVPHKQRQIADSLHVFINIDDTFSPGRWDVLTFVGNDLTHEHPPTPSAHVGVVHSSMDIGIAP